ncbi:MULTISPECIES: phospholipase D-like domain-containing protein [unclassified Achromobacter]|uniref:phospholipase D-like domain-containing protein n=1 Tax=unclassified Achromobacter TaxID=2626865 RepID=UPI000B51BED5|nr:MULTISPECIES: phospholipase D-like domain-containing protein [unclassified Achromobacter]OWT68819.1 cardiolipin synthase [Achromobacter sp. HZ28]OWT78618.1 cardiolipin synthase [Achromobacter sp. HZ34]
MSDLHDLLTAYWPHIVFTVSTVAGFGAAVHAAMTKRDVRAAIGWVGLVLFSPLFGAAVYVVAGVNRIRLTRVSQQRDEAMVYYAREPQAEPVDVVPLTGPQFASLTTLTDHISRFQLLGGNLVQPLDGGDEAYPAMLQAIRAAQRTVALQSYIFDHDPIGREIAEALIEAHRRGVKVRVLIDAVGARYSHPPIVRLLKKNGVPTARFMTNPMGVLRMPYANLRSHRKILVVDGRIGFSGGMNIRAAFVRALSLDATNRDTHFRYEGPIVAQLQSVFAHDWDFTTRESLTGPEWFHDDLAPRGNTAVRCVPSGPDRSINSTHDVLLGALAVAQRHVRIQSPYFLPDQTLIGAMATAARRGVRVDIVIPGKNNLRLVDYAMMAQIDQLIRYGCLVWRTRGAFDHSKLLTVDDAWAYTGSSNLDPRSLRLNFELDTEIYDREIASWISARIDAAIANARPQTLEALKALPFTKRLRNKIIWLATPYL